MAKANGGARDRALPTFDLETTLRQRFGLERFRPGQRPVIENVLEGRDVLCVMPTGGGKSLCYQLPALLFDGITLVVSPLIALMKDQVDALCARGVRAALLNSTLSPGEQATRIAEIQARCYDLVYVAPERFRSARFLEVMRTVRPALLAIDEAHCISEWGHDFRPDYAKLGQARRMLGSPPCVALTATATQQVRDDIALQLDLQDPAVFVAGFDRPNLIYEVAHAQRDADKLARLAGLVRRESGSSIVYTSSRKKCESIADSLTGQGIPVVVYHGGMDSESRHEAQDRFMSGEVPVIVATNAFGMGVDKPDIRSVIHFNFPGTMEAYYQEAGRAGRDGLTSHCLLLFSHGDRMIQEMFIENEYPPRDLVFSVYEYLRRQDDDPIEKTQAEIRADIGTDLSDGAVGSALKILQRAKAIEQFHPWENKGIVRINADPEGPALLEQVGERAHAQRAVLIEIERLVNRRYGETIYIQPDEVAARAGMDRAAFNRAIKQLVADLPLEYIPPFRGNAIKVADRKARARDLGIDFSAIDKKRAFEYSKLDKVIGYATTTKCRRTYILGYFGDESADNCGRCDICAEVGTASGHEPCVIDSQSGREVLLKVVSGVARCKGRVGKLAVAQMLTGSRAEKMERLGLDRLSTFGIVKDWGQAAVTQLLEALTQSGYLEVRESGRGRPVLDVSPLGWEFIRGSLTEPVTLALSSDLAARMAVRAKRKSKREAEPEARPAMPKPVLAPAPDPTPAEPAPAPSKPASAAAVAQAPTPLSKPAAQPQASKAAPSAPKAAAPPAPVPAAEVGFPANPSAVEEYVTTEEWTYRLLQRGFSFVEVSAIRGLEPAAIIRHATWIARQGRPIPLEAFLSANVVREWDEWRREHPDAPPATVQGPWSSLWQLYLTCRQAINGQS